ncbi:outer membrane beta-barrel protein [bacterium]|nr:outer membrane beta-barrel protein [bacterium]
MSNRIPLLIVATVALATTTLAQPLSYKDPVRWGRWDYGLRVLYTTSQDYAGAGGSSLALEDDLGWGFTFGYNLDDRFRLGLDFGWRSIGYEAVVVDGDVPGNTIRYGGELSTASVRLTGDWNVLPSRFTPYVNGSVGLMSVDTNILAGWESGCYWDPWWGYLCGTVPVTYGDDSAIFALGIGGRLHVSESVFFKVGYEHTWVTDLETDSSQMLRIDFGFLQ